MKKKYLKFSWSDGHCLLSKFPQDSEDGYFHISQGCFIYEDGQEELTSVNVFMINNDPKIGDNYLKMFIFLERQFKRVYSRGKIHLT